MHAPCPPADDAGSPLKNIPRGPIGEPPWDAIRRAAPTAPRGTQTAYAVQALTAALEGIELGDHDRTIIDWIAGWETPTAATICSWILRARQAGPLPTERGHTPKGSTR